MKMNFPNMPFFPYRPYNNRPYKQESVDIPKNYKSFQPQKNNYNQTRNEYNKSRNDYTKSTNEYNKSRNDYTKSKCETNQPFIEIMGIKLDFDDFLILGLLFFLYMEGNDDQMLYMVLIFLLLT